MGWLTFLERTAASVPTPSAGKAAVFVNSATGEPSYKDDAGVTTSLKGAAGAAGTGVPVGGTAGQVLEKIDGTDYNTQWSTPAGGGDVVGPASAVDDRVATFDGTTGKLIQDGGTTVAVLRQQALVVACSDETTALTTGVAKVTFRMPYAMTLTGVKASVTTAPTGAVLTVDINEGGTTILSTKLTIDATEKTSTTAATPAVISDSALAADAEITIDIDTVGSTVAGAGLKVTLLGYYA
jgi:hypothetical protein